MDRDFGSWITSQTARTVSASAVITVGMLIAGALRVRFGPTAGVNFVLIVTIIVASLPLALELIREILKGNFSVDVLAALSIVTAVVLREYWVAAIVILMLSGGKSLEEFATRRASSVLGALAKRMPHVAHRFNSDGSTSEIPTTEIRVKDTILVYPHELCPVDGVVLSGHGSMDESYLTGEPFLLAKAPGTSVISGAINGDTALTIEAAKLAVDSRYAKIVEVLHASEEHRPRIRRLADRLSAWYTPAAVLVALASWLFSGQPERFLSVLVIATPCPLLIAIPVAVIGAISVGARRGIVIKDPSILEKIESCETLVVDKTGTLTYGTPTLVDVRSYGSWHAEEVLRFAAGLEKYSKHPLASALLEATAAEGSTPPVPDDVSEPAGLGLRGHLEGHEILITGRTKVSTQLSAELPPVAPGLECVVLIDGSLAGVCRFADKPRQDSKPFLRHLGAKHNIKNIVLLSGDRPAEVSVFAHGMGIPKFYGGKSPEEKVEIVREITSWSPTLYLGDGMNDAPAMMSATAGVALGVNSEVTSEAAGAVIMQASLASVDELIHIGRRMRRIALTSAIGGMVLSLAGMAVAAGGYLLPIQGALLQEAIDLISILNSLRMIVAPNKLSDFRPDATDGTSTMLSKHTPRPLLGADRRV